MVTRDLNTYRLTFKDGTTQRINATGLIQAIENAEKDDKEVPIVQTFMVAEKVATVMEAPPKEVLFTSLVQGEAGGSIATPASGQIHVGDTITLRAIADTGWAFVEWKRKDHVIGTEETLLYKMKSLHEDEDTCVFTAVFRQVERKCFTSVRPAKATGDGCMAFPAELSVLPEQEVSAVAVTNGDWKFSHWERVNADLTHEEVGTHIVLATPATEAMTQEYVAVFTKDGESGDTEEEPTEKPEEPPKQEDKEEEPETPPVTEEGDKGEVSASFD